VLAHDLKSEDVWTRVDALQRAIWNPTEAVRQAVRELAARNQHEKAEQFFLLKALASFEEDETFAEMLRRGVPLFQEAFDIRRTKSPCPNAIRDRACAEALSGDEQLQLAGIAILSLCKGDEVAPCLQTVLASNEPTSAVARSAVLALDDIDYVSEETICLVTPMMQHREQQRVVFNYLLRRGAQAGEAAIAKYFAAHDRNEVTDFEEQAARILIARQEQTGEATKFLWHVVKQRTSVFGHNQNLLALMQSGDSLAQDLLFESSLAERSFSGSSITAIRGLMDRDSGYAFEAAMRLLESDLEAGGEDVLLTVDSARAIPFLLDFLAHDIDTLHRWRICRHLRWRAPQDQLEVELSNLAKDHDPAKRAAACEVIGWLPPGSLEILLDERINDIENAVEEAALAALKKHKE
jgi:predicted oxidoreductase (fatty acid repression mutant protein)